MEVVAELIFSTKLTLKEVDSKPKLKPKKDWLKDSTLVEKLVSFTMRTIIISALLGMNTLQQKVQMMKEPLNQKTFLWKTTFVF